MGRSNRSISSLGFAITLIAFAIISLTSSAPLWAQKPQTAVAARAAKQIPSNSINMSVSPRPGEAPVSQEEEASRPPALSPEDKALVESQMQFLQQHRISMVDDWTTRAVVASDPGTEEDAIKNGTHEHWLAVVNEPRYIMHALRHHLPVRGPGPAALLKFEQDLAARSGVQWVDHDPESEPEPFMKAQGSKPVHPGSSSRDWAVALGTAGIAPNMYPAKFDYNAGAPSCTKDYLVVGVNAAGSATQPEIVGINNVYSFCNGGNPTVMFAYHTAYNGTVKTSVTLSLDGTKIAFVESLAATARLHVLTLGTTGSNGTVAAPAVPGTGNNAVDTSLVLEGNHAVTLSSLFVDYNEDVNAGADTGFVGDNNGLLHEFSPVFTGTLTEKVSCGAAGCQAGGWPLSTEQGALTALSGPSYDPFSKNVFFGTTGTEGGLEYYARTVAASTGVCVNDANAHTGAPPCIGGFDDAGTYYQSWGYGNNAFTYIEGLAQATYGDYQDPPLVDIETEYTFWPTGSSYCYPGLAGECSVCGAPALIQITTTFATTAAAICGGSTAGNHLHLGAFDNAYYTSTATGNLWMGFPDFVGATAGIPALGEFCFGNTSAACSGSGAAAGVLGKGYEITPTGIGQLASTAQDASPVTESYDPYAGIDWMTISVASSSCGGTGTSGGCIWANNISPAASPFTCAGAACSFIPWTPNTAYPNGSEIVDTNGNLQKVTSTADAGTSSTSKPAWALSGTTMDGTPAAATGYGIVVTNNIVPTVSTTATASFTFTAQPGSWSSSLYFPGILYANGGFDFDCSVGSTGSTTYGACGTTDYYDGYNTFGDRVILIGDTLAHTVQNVVAAINSLPSSACGYTDPTAGDGVLAGTCYYPAYNQTDVTASSAGNTVTLTARVAGTGGNGTGGTGRLTGCFQNYGFNPEDYYETEPNAENITPFADTCLTGGTGSAVSTITIDGQVLSPSEPTYASGSGTFTADPANGTTVTITNGANSQTITATLAVSASAIATFSGTPAFGQGATITNGANTLSLMATPGTPAVGTINAITNPSGWATGTVTLTVGSVTYTFVNTAPALNQIKTYTSSTAAVNEAATMENVWAALSGNTAYCAAAGCINASQTANSSVTSNFLGQGDLGTLYGVVMTSNTPGAAGNFTLSTSTTADLTLTGGNNGGAGPNSCGSATNGTFVIGATTAASATNFGAAINACNTAYPAIGVTATVGTGANTCGGTTMTTSQVCVLASAGGTAGNSIGLGTLTGALPASGTINLNTNCATNNDTLTVGTVYTEKNAALTAVNQLIIPTTCYYEWASSNVAAVLDDASTLCSTAGCVFAGQPLNQAFASFTGSGTGAGTETGEVVKVTAFDPGTVGNAYTFARSRAADYTLNPATGFLAGGAAGSSGAMTGFAWSGCVPATTLCGGSGLPTSATTYAVGGGATSDATQLMDAINTAPNPANLGVMASSSSGTVTLTATAPGTGGNAITLATTSNPNFNWNSGTLSGGSNGVQGANSFVFWGGSAELNAGAIAGNIVSSITSNGTLSPLITATNTGGAGCASNCEFTLTAKANGTGGDYATTTTFANTTFYWNCPLGTSATAMCGGANGVIWTYQSPSNGESSVQRAFGTSGMVIETLDYAAWVASHAYAVKSGITDSNGYNQLAIVGGTSGASTPVWSMTPGGLTHDGTVTWMNVGESSAANLYLGTGTGAGGDAAVSYTVHGLQ